MKFFIFLIVLVSCKNVVKTNQYTKDSYGIMRKNGVWIEKVSSDIGDLQEKGKYKNGNKIGLWKTTFQRKIYQKEKFKKQGSVVRIYHENGKIAKKGQTKTELSNNSIHWFYTGVWKFYNEKGKLIYTKTYNNGSVVDSISFH